MTLIRNINTLITKKGIMYKDRALVHFTSDNLGETLSIEAEGVQITMRYKDIEKIVERERSHHYTDGHDIIDEREPDA